MTIQGTDNRNGVMQQTNDELDRDDLSKYSLDKSSDQEQFKNSKAYQQQQPILFTSMEPNWFSKELDVKMLKDPDKIYGNNKQHIDLVFNHNFKENIQRHMTLQHVWQKIGIKKMRTFS